ncbi:MULTISPECIES: fimbrial protein [unclassified Parabacteroides]|uniref:fimbrial protein n=1 Tax=unclassified Parabacteroides TaxID=2649774 RepID=UPI002475CC77|nr:MULTISPECIES: fimbrial protein [unclassified Parabacteroides]
MRKNFLFFALLANVLLFAVSCSSSENEIIQTEEKASISIKLEGQDLGTRATTAALPEENAVKNVSVYVFFSNGLLESSVTTSTIPANNEIAVDDLTTGGKKIAVVVNAPAGFPTSPILEYSDLEGELIDLDTQTTSTIGTNGLLMSGETTHTLTTGANTLNIPVYRVVAKIQLGSVTVAPVTGQTGTFTLTSVHIMKAKSTATVGVPSILTSGDLYGGVNLTSVDGKNIVSIYRDYLTKSASVSDNNTAYFYVFPNDATGTDATLMTLEGTYNGETVYFPFVINDSHTGDGTYIVRNTFHKVNVVINKPAAGATHPEEFVDPATLTVTIEPQDWETVPEQGVKW